MSTKKIKLITAGKLDIVGLKKIGKSFLLTLGAAVVGFIANSANIIDYGSAETIIATILPFVVNFLYKWLGSYESN